MEHEYFLVLFSQNNTQGDWHLLIALEEKATRKSAEIEMARNMSGKKLCTVCSQDI